VSAKNNSKVIKSVNKKDSIDKQGRVGQQTRGCLQSRVNQKKLRGISSEELVSQFLLQNGHKILGRNLRTRDAEIDILSQCGNRLFIVEVKSTKYPDWWQGPIGNLQFERLSRAALALQIKHNINCTLLLATVNNNNEIQISPLSD
jgi:Holliday junction resolvase-like predicted endonuclease